MEENKYGKGQSYQYREGGREGGGREGGESGEQPSLNKSSQLRQGQKTMELLTGIGGVGRVIAC